MIHVETCSAPFYQNNWSYAYAYQMLNICLAHNFQHCVFPGNFGKTWRYSWLFEQEGCLCDISVQEKHVTQAYIRVGQRLWQRCKVVEWNSQVSCSLKRRGILVYRHSFVLLVPNILLSICCPQLILHELWLSTYSYITYFMIVLWFWLDTGGEKRNYI